MALITCPECGREISDKAVACPGCGCPVNYSENTNQYCFNYTNGRFYNIDIKDNILTITKKSGQLVCKDYINNYVLLNTTVATAFQLGCVYVANANCGNSIRLLFHQRDKKQLNEFVHILRSLSFEEHCTIDEARLYKVNAGLEAQRANKVTVQGNLQKIANMGDILSGRGKTVCCPRCHSTSISYDTKKLSLGRAAVGGALAGPAGAVLGGVTSKKGYAVCLKCGKRWKI